MDVIQKTVKTAFPPKNVQIAHGKTVVAGITYTDGSKISHIDFFLLLIASSMDYRKIYYSCPVDHEGN